MRTIALALTTLLCTAIAEAQQTSEPPPPPTPTPAPAVEAGPAPDAAAPPKADTPPPPASDPTPPPPASDPAPPPPASDPSPPPPTSDPSPPPPAGPRVISESVAGMGTRLQIQIYTDNEDGARKAMNEAFAEITRVEALLSEWIPNSDISRLNQASGKKSVKVSDDTARVLKRGQQIGRLSDGAFALTWAALASLWDFSPGATPKLPEPSRLRQRLALIDDGRLSIDPKSLTAKLATPGMAIGVGGIGKGYAVDRAIEVLKARGFNDALVFAGGDIGVIGSKGMKPWVVGIQDPRAVGFFAVIAAKNEAVVTSGDYESFFEIKGQRYHHILDPRTGSPAKGVRSATVVAADAMSADAFATALFVLGPDKGMKLIESQPGVEGMIVDDNNEITLSSGLKNRMRIVRPPTE